MRELLEPLGDLPGVDFVMLFTPDGVPICVVDPGSENAGREQAVAALAGGWANELGHAVGPLSWGAPERVVLRCARGSLVMRPMRGAVLLLLLDPSMAPEEVRLAMDGVAARLERSLRTDERSPRTDERSPRTEAIRDEPPGPLPAPDMTTNESADEAVEACKTPSEEGLSGD